MRRLPVLLAATLALASASRAAFAQHPDGAALVRLLGARAQQAFAPPGSPGIGALVTLPPGTRASDVGLVQAAPGFARLWGPPATILAFADAHPGLPIEVAPPLHLLLDTARTYVTSDLANTSGLDGTGVLVGVADTGVDVTHPDFLDAQGHTRVAWLLDLSAAPLGKYPDLEQQFGLTDGNGNLVAGAVWAASDIDALLAQPSQLAQLPQDEVGHGTMVTSCAAGNGLQGRSIYRGVAPNATLLVARITSAGSESIGNAELLQGTAFLFNRADSMGLPVVVNLSLGTDFGPHDGTMAWEQTLASYVGPSSPGHALVAAAGNSGSIADAPIHENVYVRSGTTLHVPMSIPTASQNGGVEVWVASHAGSSVSVGLDGPDGTWIAPVGPNDSGGKNTSGYTAAVFNGQTSGTPVPATSSGAVVVWQGAWPAGTYSVTLSGTGTADLYLEGTGDEASVVWENGVREGTIALPATHPSIIGVGCTINKGSWRSIHGATLVLPVPLLDAVGAMPDPSGASRDSIPGEPCWFSGAGPTLTGIQKPEIMAPGAAIIGALSQQAIPPALDSIFTNPTCPDKAGTGVDPACQQVDAFHAASFGTSFSSPLAAGAIAVLFQHDPTLTQSDVLAALQGGAHPLRGPSAFQDQSGVGEVDVLGAVTAADRMRNTELALPVLAQSWSTLGADVFLADGSTPMQVIVELRAESTGTGAAPPADGFAADRLAAYVLVDGLPYPGGVSSLVRRGPGVWLATVQLPGGLGGNNLTVGMLFDGADIVARRSVPIATDAWNADYPPTLEGGCVVAKGQRNGWGAGAALLGGALVLRGWGRRGRRRRAAAAASPSAE
jgi:subtilisin family serine protease